MARLVQVEVGAAGRGALRLERSDAWDPGARRNVAESHPDVLRRQLDRIQELSRAPASQGTGMERLSEPGRAPLEALGHLDGE